MKNRITLLIVLVGALSSLSCKSGEELDPSIEKLGRATGPASAAPRPAMPPAAAAEPSEPEGQAVLEGTVLERILVPSYTYIRFSMADGREMWAAVPRVEIEVGARVRVVQSLVMRKFSSPSLGRTFEEIVFGTLEGGPDAATPAAAKPGEAAAATANPTPAPAAPAAPGSGGALPAGHPPIGQ
jgi:hypothetical protein